MTFINVHYLVAEKAASFSLTPFSETYELRICMFMKVNDDRWNDSVPFKEESVMYYVKGKRDLSLTSENDRNMIDATRLVVRNL